MIELLLSCITLPFPHIFLPYNRLEWITANITGCRWDISDRWILDVPFSWAPMEKCPWFGRQLIVLQFQKKFPCTHWLFCPLSWPNTTWCWLMYSRAYYKTFTNTHHVFLHPNRQFKHSSSKNTLKIMIISLFINILNFFLVLCHLILYSMQLLQYNEDLKTPR